MKFITLKQEYTNRETNENFFVDCFLNPEAIESIRKVPNEDFYSLKTFSGEMMVLSELDYKSLIDPLKTKAYIK